MGDHTLRRAAKLAKTNPKAAYSLVLGTDPASLAKRDPKTAYMVVLAQQELPMGDWVGARHFWPTPDDFEVLPEKKDLLGDYQEVTYQFNGDLNLTVTMSTGPFGNMQGGGLGSFHASYYSTEEGGTWKDEAEILAVLQGLVAKANQAQYDLAAALAKVGAPKWRATYDWGQLSVDLVSPTEATMNVTFEDVTGVIFGKQETGEATITFTAGVDPTGSYGQQNARETYRSIEDIEAILAHAERLWDDWTRAT